MKAAGAVIQFHRVMNLDAVVVYGEVALGLAVLAGFYPVFHVISLPLERRECSKVEHVLLLSGETGDRLHRVRILEPVQTTAAAPEVGGHAKGIEHLDLLAAGGIKAAVAAPLAAGGGL